MNDAINKVAFLFTCRLGYRRAAIGSSRPYPISCTIRRRRLDIRAKRNPSEVENLSNGDLASLWIRVERPKAGN